MFKARKIFAIIGGLSFGILFIYAGVRELQNSKQLQKRGQAATAKVTDASEWVTGTFRSHSYYLTLSFKAADGTWVNQKVSTSKEVYDSGTANGTVNVHYLAEDPTICAAGDQVELRYHMLLLGIFVLGVATYLIVVYKQPGSIAEAAENIEGHLKTISNPRYEYAKADPANFRHLDLAYYDQSQKFLEEHGYTFLDDQENISLRSKNNNPALLRFLISADRATVAILYHFKPKMLRGREAKVLDLETQFSNGWFVTTSNAEMAGHFDSPPTIRSKFLPATATLEMVQAAHAEQLTHFMEENPGVAAVPQNNMEDVRRSGDELQRVKAEYRQIMGLSKQELERIARRKGGQIDALHAALVERQAEKFRAS